MLPGVVVAEHAAAHLLASGCLAEHAAEMAATPSASEYLSYLVACALPADRTLTVGSLEYFGELGLAPTWTSAALSRAGREAISACVLARLNDRGVELEISMRGPRLELSSDEKEVAPVEEGAFWGDLFTAADQPLTWFACRGRGSLDAGGLIDRTCGRQDPAHLDSTLCGLSFAGPCPLICDMGRDFYRRCGGNTQALTVYVGP